MVQRETHLAETKGRRRRGVASQAASGRCSADIRGCAPFGSFFQSPSCSNRATQPIPRHLPQEKRKQTFISKPALGRSQRLRLQKPKTVEMTQTSISRMGSAPGRGKHMRGGLCSFQHPFPDPTATEHPRRSRLWAEGRRYGCEQRRDPSHPRPGEADLPAEGGRTTRYKDMNAACEKVVTSKGQK